MSRNTKIVLGILGGLVLICICVGVAAVIILRQAGDALEEAIITDPQEAAAIGSSIADYDLPAGYAQKGISLFGFDMVMIMSEQYDDSMFVMMQFPPNTDIDPEQMEQQIRQQVNRQMGSSGVDLEPVEMREMEIRGETVRIQVSEGSGADGEQIRQMVGMFPGKGGPAMLLISAPIASWDENLVDSFIASLR